MRGNGGARFFPRFARSSNQHLPGRAGTFQRLSDYDRNVVTGIRACGCPGGIGDVHAVESRGRTSSLARGRFLNSIPIFKGGVAGAIDRVLHNVRFVPPGMANST